MSAVQEISSQVGTAAACEALGVSRATVYRRRCPPPAKEQENPRPSSHRKLHPEERQAVLAALNSEEFVDMAPAAIHAALLDQGTYLCSVRTMYRVLTEEGPVRERRDQLRHPAYKKPELVATRPNQVWSWDITKLAGPEKGIYYSLYVMLDIYSRCAVAWDVAPGESGQVAQHFIQAAMDKEGIRPGHELTIHSDRGAPMRSKPVAFLLADLGVIKSHSRPRVSNDNAFSESQFKTMKYRPAFPERFGSIQDARAFLREFFRWYNEEHHHSGIAMLTPGQVHRGLAHQVLEQRGAVLAAAHQGHPERFVRGVPALRSLPEAVWINPPAAVAVTAGDLQ